jgi:hypothetical protein
MASDTWLTLSGKLSQPVTDGYTLDRPTPAELDTAISEYEVRAGFHLPASYREFLKQFGPGELAGYFCIYGPFPRRLCTDGDNPCDLESLWIRVFDPDGSWATDIEPALTQRLVPFADTIGGDWLFWDINDVRDSGKCEYGVYGASRDWREKIIPVAASFADFVTDVCLGRGFPETEGWKPRWEFVSSWPRKAITA